MSRPIPFDDTISPSEVAQHLKRMRQLAGFTQGRAAKRVRLSRHSIEAYESGKNLDKFCVILALFESYGCTVIFKPPKTPDVVIVIE